MQWPQWPRPELFPARPLLAETHLLGKLRPRRRIIRCDHWVIRAEVPFLAVLLGRHFVLGPQMTLKRLELLSVLKADDVIRRDRFLQRHRRLVGLRCDLAPSARHAGQSAMDLVDKRREILRRYRVVAHISRNDAGRQLDERSA